jgi:hypothetical protein
LAFLEQLERNNLKPVFDGVGNFAGMGSWHLSHRVSLAKHEEVLNLSDVILGFALGGATRLDSVRPYCAREIH